MRTSDVCRNQYRYARIVVAAWVAFAPQLTLAATWIRTDLRHRTSTILQSGGRVTAMVLAEGERGISVQPVTPHSDIDILPPPAKITPSPGPPEPSATKDKPQEFPAVRLASTDGQTAPLVGLRAKVPYKIVDQKANPDALWNPLTREVMTDGIVSAHNVGRDDLASIIDRIGVLHWIQTRTKSARQSVRILPDERVHKKEAVVEIQLDGLAHRWLILINLAGDGTLQLLYPRAGDSPVQEDPQYRLQLQVKDPLGADEIVAISSVQPMAALSDALLRLDSARDPTKLKEAIENLGPLDVLLGSAGLLTAP
jgi:hypothetical protein